MRAVGNLAVPFPGTAIWRYNAASDTVSYSVNLRSMLGRTKGWRPFKLTDLVEGARINRHADRPVRRFLDNPFLEMQENGFIKLTYFLNGNWLELKVTVTERHKEFVGYEAKLELTSAPNRPDSDELTGLPIGGLVQRLAGDCLASLQPGRVVAYYRLDLDYFRVINLYGHQAGDAALRRFARALEGVAEKWGDSVVIGRVGGDEFIAAGLGLTPDQVDRVSDDLVLATDFEVSVETIGTEHRFPVTASIGMATSDGSVSSIEELDGLADCAQGWAKGHKSGDGTNRFCVYSEGLGAKSLDNLKGVMEIRNALLDQEIAPRYEPLVDANFQVVGVEALSRWHRPQNIISTPGEFLRSLSGLITQHDLQIMHMAASDIRRIEKLTGRRLQLHTNITPSALGNKDLVREIKTVLDSTGLKPDQLVLEIVELDGLPALPTASSNARRLIDLGVRLALDDYPMGKSSTVRLIELPYFSIVKLSGELIRFISNDQAGNEDAELRRQSAIRNLKAEIHKFKSLGMTILAEQVASLDVAQFLHSAGVDMMQGYLFGSFSFEDEHFESRHAMDRDRIVRVIRVMEEEQAPDGWPALLQMVAVSA